jgi:hypothetical protein
VQSATLKQLCQSAEVPGEARNRRRLFAETLDPSETSKAMLGIGGEFVFWRRTPFHSASHFAETDTIQKASG